MRISLILCTILAAYGSPSSALELDVAVNEVTATAAAGGSSGVNDDNTIETVTESFTESLFAEDSGTSSVAEIEWILDGPSVVISVNSTYFINGLNPGIEFVGTEIGSIGFSPDVDSTYEISGSLSYSGPSGFWIRSVVDLRDLSLPVGDRTLFEDTAESIATADESFVVGGGAEGDFLNIDVGNAMGNLKGGTTYVFSVIQQISEIDETTAGIDLNGNGNIMLRIEELAPVPLPASILLFSPALIALGVWRCR
jgi:hypothetical protein